MYNLVTNFIDRIDETGLLPLSLTPLSYFYVVFISSVSKQTPLWQQKACVLTRPVLWDYHVILISKELPFYMMDHILATEYDKQTIDRIRDMSPLVHETNTNSNSGHMEEKCPAMFVYDLDSKLPFPTEGMEYCSSSIRPEIPLPEEHEQQFRVVSAHDFINNFASDRSVCKVLLQMKIILYNFMWSRNYLITHSSNRRRLTLGHSLRISSIYRRSHMEKSGAPDPDWPCIRSLFAQSSMNLHEYTTMIEEDSSIASNQSQADVEKGIHDR